jgi:hypothetical protein
MNGLLEKGMAPSAPVPAGTQPAAPSTPSGVNQRELDIFVANGLKIVHDPKVSDKLIKQAVESKTPVEAIADATIFIVSRLEQSSKDAGKKLSLTTLAYGANVIMGEIIASAEAAGMEELEDDAKYQAFSLAVGKYLDEAVKTGKMTEEEVLQLGRDAEETEIGKKIISGGEMSAQGTVPPTTKPGLIGGV